jgi:hypothetical protein
VHQQPLLPLQLLLSTPPAGSRHHHQAGASAEEMLQWLQHLLQAAGQHQGWQVLQQQLLLLQPPLERCAAGDCILHYLMK